MKRCLCTFLGDFNSLSCPLLLCMISQSFLCGSIATIPHILSALTYINHPLQDAPSPFSPALPSGRLFWVVLTSGHHFSSPPSMRNSMRPLSCHHPGTAVLNPKVTFMSSFVNFWQTRYNYPPMLPGQSFPGYLLPPTLLLSWFSFPFFLVLFPAVSF